MRFRKLRIGWSAGCVLACVVLIALWVRSYWRYDTFTGQSASQYFQLLVAASGSAAVTASATMR